MTDLAQYIADAPLCDTHEHLASEREWVEQGPDIRKTFSAIMSQPTWWWPALRKKPSTAC